VLELESLLDVLNHWSLSLGTLGLSLALMLMPPSAGILKYR
jgi:hypothetical protein